MLKRLSDEAVQTSLHDLLESVLEQANRELCERIGEWTALNLSEQRNDRLCEDCLGCGYVLVECECEKCRWTGFSPEVGGAE